jgi:hypothetical protein
MRMLSVVVVCVLLPLAGCATRWTVFGHSMGGPAAEGAGQPAVTAAAPAAGATPAAAAPASAAAPAPAVASASTVARAAATAPPAVPESTRFTAVTIAFTPAAKEKIAAEPQFTPGELFAAVKTELRAQKLLDESDPGAGDTLGIVIDDFATRPTSNAVLFGFVFSTATLKGNLEVLTSDGKELRNMRIAARSSLTKPVDTTAAGNGQSNFFTPLYRGFAELTARNLTGAPEPVAVNH